MFFRERKGERERQRVCEREKESTHAELPPLHALTGAQTPNKGMCPDQESNLQPFGAN